MNKYICENCGKEHDGTYGNGRFCSKQCSSSHNAKKIKDRSFLIQLHNSRKSPYGTWKCPYCDFIAETREQLKKHKHQDHKEYCGKSHKCWCKGLTKETSSLLEKKGKTFKDHLKNGIISPSWKGRKHTEEQKKKISNSMKKAHAGGRAHNIGESRWNNSPSYPEEWMIKMLFNEFGMTDGIDYKREVPFHKYSLDFAWIDKKKSIEIDGEQHKRFLEQQERDMKKDELLQQEGWSFLRIAWKDIFNNPKEWILRIKEFLQ